MFKKIVQKIKFELKFNNTAYYTRLSDKIIKTKYRWLLRKKITLLTPINLKATNANLTLAILCNKKNFFESIAALYSFCYWTRDICINYHEDGTLGNDEIDLLKHIFPGIIVFIKSEQTLKVKDHLSSKNLVNCAELRNHFVFAIRLFDMVMEKRTPFLLQVDSDVLFFSRPDELLNILDQSVINGCFNADKENVYTYSSDIIAKYINGPLINNFNAGLFMHNFDEDLFDFIEHVLKNEPQGKDS